MSTYRELIYMVNDEVKLLSDDSTFTEDHILFLLKKYRPYLIEQKYQRDRQAINDDNKQRICIELETVDTGNPCGNGIYVKSKYKIPSRLQTGSIKFYNIEGFPMDMITFVPFQRLAYVGNNKYLKNIIYCAISTDGYLYFDNSNPQTQYLQRIIIDGLFEDPEEAEKLQCKCDGEQSESDCDIMDKKFPIEGELIPLLIQSVIKELIGSSYRPKDVYNNALDDLSDLATFIRRNAKSHLNRQIDGDDVE